MVCVSVVITGHIAVVIVSMICRLWKGRMIQKNQRALCVKVVGVFA